MGLEIGCVHSLCTFFFPGDSWHIDGIVRMLYLRSCVQMQGECHRVLPLMQWECHFICSPGRDTVRTQA